MRGPSALLTLLLAIALALAGCTGDGDGGDDQGGPDQDGSDEPGDDQDEDGDDGGTGGGGDDNETEPEEGPTRSLTFTGDIVQGNVPLVVNFSLDATDQQNVTGWTFESGDGEGSEEGTTLPADVSYTYEAEGNYTATFTVTYVDEEVLNDTLLVAVRAPTGGGGGGAPEDVYIDLQGEMPLFAPAGLPGLADEGGDFCDMDDYARDNGLNGTYIEFYDLEVQEGFTRVYIEGGAEPLDPDGLFPDFDVFIQSADGTCTVGGSEGSYETAAVNSGGAGTFTVALLYWTGPPNAAYTGFIEVNYGSFVQ